MTSDSEKKRLDALHRELRIYRMLGVPRFRKLILGYARVRHARRGGRNPRYHLRQYSMDAVREFLPRLRHNVRLHLYSLAMVGLYWAAAAWGGLSFPGEILLTGFLLWLNIGCLLLQRWHYVRILLLQEKQKNCSIPENHG